MDYIQIGFAALGLFSVIATQTKNKSDDKIVQKLYDIINVLGGNYGKAKNKDV